MSEHQPDQSDEDLDRAIRAVLSYPAPQDARQRSIETAAAWTPSSLRPHRKQRWRMPAMIACAAASLLIAAAAGLLFRTFWNRAPEVDVAGRQDPNVRKEVIRESSPPDAKSKINADIAQHVRNHHSEEPGEQRHVGPITFATVDSGQELARLEIDLAALQTRLIGVTADAQRLSVQEALARVFVDYHRLLARNDTK